MKEIDRRFEKYKIL